MKAILHLSRLLGERKMTQAELARQTGIRPNTNNDWYRGLAERINLDHLVKICSVLDCKVEDMIEFMD